MAIVIQSAPISALSVIRSKHCLPQGILTVLLCLLALPGGLQAQDEQPPRYTFSGTVRDSADGEPMAGAQVVVPALETGTLTDENGRFALELPAGAHEAVVQVTGMKQRRFWIQLDGDLVRNIRLGSFSTSVVTVEGDRSDQLSTTQMGTERLDALQIKQMPMLFGEADPLRAIQMLPGVQAAGEGNTGFNVRGGSVGQNKILLDNAQLYSPAHLLGFFSIFNADALKDVTLHKGAIPAQYGGRLASIVDIRTREGRRDRFGMTGGIGVIAARLTAEGPIGEKGSFLLSGRRTYADLFLKLSSNEDINENRLFFFDFNGKFTYDLGEKDKLMLSGYTGRDLLEDADFFNFNFGNQSATLRWKHLFSEKLFLNTSLIYSKYDYEFGFQLTDSEFINTLAGQQNGTLRMKFSQYPNEDHQINYGFTSTYTAFRPGKVDPESDSSFVAETELDRKFSLESAVFYDHEWTINHRWSVRGGLRLSHFARLGPSDEFRFFEGSDEVQDTVSFGRFEAVDQYVNLLPRFGVRYQLTEQSALKASFDRTAQYVNLIANSATTLPVNLWYPAGNTLDPQTGEQVALGYFRNLGGDAYEFSAEAYYKWLHNQVDFKDFADIFFNQTVEADLLQGSGRAYGVELMLKKVTGRFSGWVSYTYSRSKRTIPGINGGETFRAVFDRPHYATLVANYKLNEEWRFGATWVFASGQPLTFPTGVTVFNGLPVPVFEERNNYRVPAYHRGDISLTWDMPEDPGQRWDGSLNFSIYNFYGKKNPFIIESRTAVFDTQDPGRFGLDNLSEVKAVKVILFTFVPALTYNFTF